MKRILPALAILVFLTGQAFAQRMTEAQERQRFETLLGYAQGADPPSRDTARKEMAKFGAWIEPELLGRLSAASIVERQLFWTVLYDRGCRAATGPAVKMLPEAIERCRQAQIAVYEVSQLRQQMNKAKREGNNALADQLAGQIESARGRVPWNEIVQGDEVAILCAFLADFGRENEMKVLAEIALASSMDDALAKGFRDRQTRTHRDRPLPGGTEMWNTVYNPVWEALRGLAQRALDKKVLAAVDSKLSGHFEKLEKTEMGPNQQAAVDHFHAVQDSLRKTDRNTGEDGDSPDKPKGKDDGVGIIKM